MTALQIAPSRPDPIKLGSQSIARPSPGLGENSQFIERSLQRLLRPSPTFSAEKSTSTNLDEQLYDALASFKIRTAEIAMHLDREWRTRLFRQLDNLLAFDDWETDDLPPSLGSFATFLRMIIFLKPTKMPGLGATCDGNLIAAWTAGDDRLTIECQPRDILRWNLSATIDGERERSAAITPLRRLSEVLKPYRPGRWFGDGGHLSPA